MVGARTLQFLYAGCGCTELLSQVIVALPLALQGALHLLVHVRHGTTVVYHAMYCIAVGHRCLCSTMRDTKSVRLAASSFSSFTHRSCTCRFANKDWT